MPKLRQSSAKKHEEALRNILLGEYLLGLRERSGQPQRTVTEELNFSPTYLSEIERGLKAPSPELLRQLARYYNVDEALLFDKLGKVPLGIPRMFRISSIHQWA